MVTNTSTPERAGWAARHAWFVVLLVGSALYIAVLQTFARTQNPNLVPSLILLGAFLIPVTFVTFIYQRVAGRDRSAQVSPDLIALAALFGGVIGTVVAGSLEYDTMHRLGTVPMVAVGLIEEAAKLVVPIAMLILLRRRRPESGLLVGVAVGMGFAALETMGYAFVTLLQTKLDVTAVERLLFLRGVLSPAAHAAWTGLATAALWRAAAAGRRGRPTARLRPLRAGLPGRQPAARGLGRRRHLVGLSGAVRDQHLPGSPPGPRGRPGALNQNRGHFGSVVLTRTSVS
jgi:protease PrsW